MSAASRALRVLELVAASPTPLAHGELSSSLEIPKSTLFDLLAELRRLGYVQPADGGYVAGPALMTLAYRATHQLGTIPGLRRMMEELAIATGETVVFAVEVGGDVESAGGILIVDQVVSPNPIRYVAPIGAPRPLEQTAAGRVILAFSEKDAGDGALASELDQVRAQGYAINVAPSGATSIAVPLHDRRGTLAGAISVTGPSERMRDAEQRILPVLACSVRSLGEPRPAVDTS